MKLYFFTKLTSKVLCLILFLDFFHVVFWPDINLILWAIITIFLDLLTGIVKAHVKKEFVVSTGIRKTLTKLFQYVATIAICFIFTNIVASNTVAFQQTVNFIGDNLYTRMRITFRYLNNLVLLIIVYTEFLSIIENLMEIDDPGQRHRSKFSKYVLKPMHVILTLYIINNPFKKLSEKKVQEIREQDKKETILKP